MVFDRIVDKVVDVKDRSIDSVLEGMEKLFDKTADVIEGGSDAATDLAERVSDKFADSVFMNKLMVLQARKGIWPGHENTLRSLQVSQLNELYTQQQNWLKDFEGVLVNLRSIQNPDKIVLRDIEYYEARKKGLQLDIKAVGSEIERRQIM